MAKRQAILILALAAPFAAHAQDADQTADLPNETTTRCVSATVLVPPFNDTAEALEQSRIAASTVEEVREANGEDAVPVCRTSAVMPELAEIEGLDEEVVTEEDMRGAGAEDIAPASGA